MKKAGFFLCVGLLASASAQAQSSVTLFGLVDAGISYISNDAGHPNLRFDGQGIYSPNFLGFMGQEDLGGGYKVVFKLVDQFDMGNGSILPGQSLFTETAYVGLSSARYGALTLGQQYDFMTDSLIFQGVDATIYGLGFYNFRNGPFAALDLPSNPTGAFNWDRVSGTPVSNSVKYVSPSLGGFTFGAMYGFGNIAGNVGSNNAVSAGLTYTGGPLAAGAAYTRQNYSTAPGGSPQISISNWGIGARYTYGSFGTNGLVTTVHNALNGGGIYMVQVGQTWAPAPDMLVAFNYMYMKGNEVLSNNHAHQLGAAFSYFLSKRTVAYVSAAYQKANDGAQALINGLYDGPASSSSQAIFRVGIKTGF